MMSSCCWRCGLRLLFSLSSCLRAYLCACLREVFLFLCVHFLLLHLHFPGLSLWQWWLSWRCASWCLGVLLFGVFFSFLFLLRFSFHFSHCSLASQRRLFLELRSFFKASFVVWLVFCSTFSTVAGPCVQRGSQ